MADPVETLREHVAVVAGLSRRMPAGFVAIGEVPDTELVALLPAAQAVVQAAQGLMALAAGEIAVRRGTPKQPSLAQRLGHRNARALVADRAGVSFGEAARLVDVGAAIRPGTDASGQPVEPERAHVAEAVLAGELSLTVARLIDETLEALAPRLDPVELDTLEGALVERATSGDCSVAERVRECRRLTGGLDPEGADDRDAALKAKASIRQTTLSNGLLRIVAELDPERAAYYLAAMAARTNPRRGADEEGPTAGPRAADAAAAGASTAGGATEGPAAADVTSGAAGGPSELLDQGRARRVFTKAQRYAIHAGYDGCAFPGCGLPLSMTEIHHVGRWATRHQHRRGTDLGNGVPLCGFHNRLMETGWDARLDPDGIPWFSPPAVLDRRRTPLRGARRPHLAQARAA